MMKILVLGHRTDETPLFEKANKYGYQVEYTEKIISEEDTDITRGYDALVLGVQNKITDNVAKKLSENGVKYLLTRAAGRDHLAQKSIDGYGLLSANVPAYSPHSVAEYAVMSILEVIRKRSIQMARISQQRDFRITGVCGHEMNTRTIGIIGAGRIGTQVIHKLAVFGCRILVYDRNKNEQIEKEAEYTSLETLLKESDCISLHCPLTQDNYHLIDEKAIAMMKNGVCIVNAARGGLVDTKALLDGIDTGKIESAVLDVCENEEIYKGRFFDKGRVPDELVERLITNDRVILTSHTAFYTVEALQDIISTVFENLHDFETKGKCANNTAGLR